VNNLNIKQRHLYIIKRKEKKIRLTEIAKFIGISVSALSQHETGGMGLKKDNLETYRNYIDSNDNRNRGVN
jgi:transcriptional regulator with XRE-family HTH domain